MGLIDDYLREVESTLRADPARKRQIVDELRAHLHDKVAEERARDPAASPLDVERRVLADFGSARDLALAYEPEGGAVLKNQAGEIVLRVGEVVGRGARAVGRGTGKLLKWVAVSTAVLLVVAIALGVWAFYEVRPVVETLASQSVPAYSYHEECLGTPCSGAIEADRFYVSNQSREVRVSLDVDPPWRERENATGTVRIVIADPTGSPVLDRNVTLGNRSSMNHEARFAAIEGNWTVSYEYSAFRGTVDVETFTWSLGWRDL